MLVKPVPFLVRSFVLAFQQLEDLPCLRMLLLNGWCVVRTEDVSNARAKALILLRLLGQFLAFTLLFFIVVIIEHVLDLRGPAVFLHLGSFSRDSLLSSISLKSLLLSFLLTSILEKTLEL